MLSLRGPRQRGPRSSSKGGRPGATSGGACEPRRSCAGKALAWPASLADAQGARGLTYFMWTRPVVRVTGLRPIGGPFRLPRLLDSREPTNGPVNVPVVPVGASVSPSDRNATRGGLYVDPLMTRAAVRTIRRGPAFNPPPIEGPSTRSLSMSRTARGKDKIYVPTEHDIVSALDATGNLLWQKQVGTLVPLAALDCADIDPVGITGTPVRLDPGPSFNGSARDYFVLSIWAYLDDPDLELGGCQPIPNDMPGAPYPHLVAAGDTCRATRPRLPHGDPCMVGRSPRGDGPFRRLRRRFVLFEGDPGSLRPMWIRGTVRHQPKELRASDATSAPGLLAAHQPFGAWDVEGPLAGAGGTMAAQEPPS